MSNNNKPVAIAQADSYRPNKINRALNEIFRSLGMNYIQAYKQDPNVISATVIFLTDPAADYAALRALAKKSADVTGTLTHIFEGLPTDCSACALKDICDEVEGMKELHFGVGAKGSDKH